MKILDNTVEQGKQIRHKMEKIRQNFHQFQILYLYTQKNPRISTTYYDLKGIFTRSYEIKSM